MPIDDALREELLAMAAEDQDARKSIDPDDPASAGRVLAADARNLARFREIVAEHGWPGNSLVGEDGAGAAWLLAQHADADDAFQHGCLELLDGAAAEGEASLSHLAYLTDRVLVHDGRPQRFGTQFRQVGESFEPYPIEDEERVDERRLEAGLPSLSTYRELMETRPSKPRVAPRHRAEVLDEAPEPLPPGVVEGIMGAASVFPDLVAVYLVAQRRTWPDGRSERGRMLQLVVQDAPDGEPLARTRAMPIAAEMFAALARGGEVDVSVGFAAPRFVPTVEARGSLLWSREPV